VGLRTSTRLRRFRALPRARGAFRANHASPPARFSVVALRKRPAAGEPLHGGQPPASADLSIREIGVEAVGQSSCWRGRPSRPCP
jgi:hypothetical protein